MLRGAAEEAARGIAAMCWQEADDVQDREQVVVAVGTEHVCVLICVHGPDDATRGAVRLRSITALRPGTVWDPHSGTRKPKRVSHEDGD